MFKIQIFKTETLDAAGIAVWNFEFRSFEFVSNFDIRISDLTQLL